MTSGLTDLISLNKKIAVNVLKVQSGARTRVYGVADRRPTTWLSALIYQESPLVNLQKRPDS